MSNYRCSEHDTHQRGCSTCEVAKDYYDKDARIERLTKERNEAINRINDMLMGDDGQAYKEARKFIAKHSGEEK